MKFSICIPTLNEEKYIGGLLGCLVKQTFKDFEVIVADGSSIDKTKDEVLKFKDSLDILFLESPTRGVSFQRNYAAQHSHHDYIIFFDADVMIEDDFIEKIDNFLKNKDVDILTSWNKPLSKKLSDKFIFLIMNLFTLELIKKDKPGAVGVFICVKKKSFEKIGGFREKIRVGEDYDLAKRFHESGFIYVLLKNPKIGVSVRRLDKEGRLTMVLKTSKGAVYYLFGGKDYIDKFQGKIKYETGKF